MFFIVLDILAKNKKFGVLIQSFNLFHKVFVLCFFICFKMFKCVRYLFEKGFELSERV